MILLLFLGAALMNAAMAIASPVATIVAADRLGAAWGAVPNTAAVLGTGFGAVLLTRLTGRWGWRTGLVTGYATAAAGGASAVVFVARHDVGGLTLAMLLLGVGNAGALLSRYAAAEHYLQRRGFAIGAVVWSGALGAVGAPLLLAPLGTVGALAFAGATSGLAALAMLLLPNHPRASSAPRVAFASLVRGPAARSAFAVMATAQVVMAAVMTATPLQLHLHHQTLGHVGLVVSAHTLGMFALSPLTGWLLDRVGAGPVMAAGLSLLALASVLAGVAVGGWQAGALFLLGFGWNLCFVGGSGRLAGRLSTSDQAAVEGAVDAAVWGAAAGASLASTAVLSATGYGALATLSAGLVIVPAAILISVARPVRRPLAVDG